MKRVQHKPISKKFFQVFDDFKHKLYCLHINEAMQHPFDIPHAFEYFLMHLNKKKCKIIMRN